MKGIKIIKYSDQYEKKWDYFIKDSSINGNFLNTRNFLNYHDRLKFIDHSLMIYKKNELIAVIPACEEIKNKKKRFISHKGSTFGGIIIKKEFNDINHVEEILIKVESYFKEKNFDEIIIKFSPFIFNKDNTEILSYYMFKNNYKFYDELSMYIDFYKYLNDIKLNFNKSKRRDLNYSLKNNFEFKKIKDNEIEVFYNLLCKNLEKHETKPIHTIGEIRTLINRLKENIDFYGVYYDQKMICGAMIFKFDRDVYHTQYLALDYEYKDKYPMNFLNYKLIENAKTNGFRYFSFGTNTLDRGKILNKELARFKEGFGSQGIINRTYYKTFRED